MKSSYMVVFVAVAAGILICSFSFKPDMDDKIPFPVGYRHWTHVKTYIVMPKNPAFRFIGGFNHVYANDLAMRGYRTGRFPDGSVIVNDVVVANHDTLNVREGSRHHVDVMVRDSAKYAAIGGWSFESFGGDTKDNGLLTPQTRSNCTNCHKKQNDMVFGDYRE